MRVCTFLQSRGDEYVGGQGVSGVVGRSLQALGEGELSDLLWRSQIPTLCKESGHKEVRLLHTESLFKSFLGT